MPIRTGPGLPRARSPRLRSGWSRRCCSRSTSPISRTTTRPTERSAASSSCSSGFTSPAWLSWRAPSSTPKSNMRRRTERHQGRRTPRARFCSDAGRSRPFGSGSRFRPKPRRRHGKTRQQSPRRRDPPKRSRQTSGRHAPVFPPTLTRQSNASHLSPVAAARSPPVCEGDVSGTRAFAHCLWWAVVGLVMAVAARRTRSNGRRAWRSSQQQSSSRCQQPA